MLLTWRDGRTAGPLRLDVAMAATCGRTWEEASSTLPETNSQSTWKWMVGR